MAAPSIRDRLTLGPKEAARALGVCDNTVRRWMREGGLPYSRYGGRVLIRVDRLLDWIDQHEENPRERVDELLRLVGRDAPE